MDTVYLFVLGPWDGRLIELSEDQANCPVGVKAPVSKPLREIEFDSAGSPRFLPAEAVHYTRRLIWSGAAERPPGSTRPRFKAVEFFAPDTVQDIEAVSRLMKSYSDNLGLKKQLPR